MDSQMHMIEIPVAIDGLARFLAAQGLASRSDQDLGYGMHAWLQAAFGDLSPKQFRLFGPKSTPGHAAGDRPWRMLGYGEGSAEALREHLLRFGDPSTLGACDPGGLASRPVVRTWPRGQRLSYEVLCCPVTRTDKNEKDAYLRHLDRTGGQDDLGGRPAVYARWFAKQVEGAARLRTVDLEEFSLAKHLRKDAATGGQRKMQTVVRPRALLKGELEVDNPTEFYRRLARGIGRHRAFGYGMLLLRPSR